MNIPAWMLQFIQNYDVIALFITSFIGATIVPASSAAILLAALAMGAAPFPTFVACSLGNSLGCAANYGLGYVIGKPLIPKLKKSKSGRKALFYSQKYGLWSLLISWAPFIGDPLTIAAGIFRLNFLMFSLIVYTQRVIGYFLITLYFLYN